MESAENRPGCDCADALNNPTNGSVAAVRAARLIDDDGAPKYTGVHAARHFFASWCINAPDRGGQGLPIKEAQQLLGHSSIQLTAHRYGHLFPAAKDAHKKLEDAERALLG